mmetsp:Transcript_3342/g.12424  ORF Transcript_3342/g.12424 Transcript_3342/m.12424 type:complete len:206 (+) Transcript_3342:522-1139(+)
MCGRCRFRRRRRWHLARRAFGERRLWRPRRVSPTKIRSPRRSQTSAGGSPSQATLHLNTRRAGGTTTTHRRQARGRSALRRCCETHGDPVMTSRRRRPGTNGAGECSSSGQATAGRTRRPRRTRLVFSPGKCRGRPKYPTPKAVRFPRSSRLYPTRAPTHCRATPAAYPPTRVVGFRQTDRLTVRTTSEERDARAADGRSGRNTR